MISREDVRAFAMMLVNFGSLNEESQWPAGKLARWLVTSNMVTYLTSQWMAGKLAEWLVSSR